MTLEEFTKLLRAADEHRAGLDQCDYRIARNKIERIVNKVANRKATLELSRVLDKMTVGNNGELYDYIKETIINFENHDY